MTHIHTGTGTLVLMDCERIAQNRLTAINLVTSPNILEQNVQILSTCWMIKY